MRATTRLAQRALIVTTAAAVAVTMVLVVPNAASAYVVSSPNEAQTSGDDAVGRIAVGYGATDPNATVETDVRVSVDSNSPSAHVYAGEDSVVITLLSVSATRSESSDLAQVYSDVAVDTDAVVQAVDGGVQFLSVMHTSSAPTTQRYQLDMPAGTTLVSAGGGFTLLGSDGETVGAVEEPWATDAAGVGLPTSYELDGTVLVQRTDTTGATYPIVADPKLTFGWGVYLNLWGTEIKAIAIAATAVLGGGTAVGCTTIGKLPNQVLRSLATLICGAAAVNLKNVFSAIVNISRTTNIVNNRCYQKKIVPNSGSFKSVGTSNCS